MGSVDRRRVSLSAEVKMHVVTPVCYCTISYVFIVSIANDSGRAVRVSLNSAIDDVTCVSDSVHRCFAQLCEVLG